MGWWPTDPTRRYWTSFLLFFLKVIWETCLNPKSFTCDLCHPSVTRSSVCSWILVFKRTECSRSSLITCSLHLRTNLLCRMILPEAWCCQSAIYLWFLQVNTVECVRWDWTLCFVYRAFLSCRPMSLENRKYPHWRLFQTTVTIRSNGFLLVSTRWTSQGVLKCFCSCCFLLFRGSFLLLIIH